MGKYPIDALKMMVSIVEETEAYLDYSAYRRRKVTEENMKNISNAVAPLLFLPHMTSVLITSLLQVLQDLHP